VSDTPVPSLHPDLAVEVLSRGNTDEEMDEKLRDYFASGATLVWLVDPDSRSVLVFTSPNRPAARRLSGADVLDGGPVLPGFALPVRDLFAELDPH
jgi:Uma2 family endonuclease